MNDTFYQLSLNILKALGGDVTIVYPDADAIWDEINKIYNNAGNRFDIVPLEKTITENGEYEYYPDGDVDAFMPVNLTVNIPQKYTDEQVFEIESNAIKQGYNNGYSEGETAGKLIGREEGYTDGFNTGYSDGVTDGIENQKSKLVDITITENGVYTKEDGYKTVTVEVEGGIPEEELQQMLQDAMDEGYQDGYAEGVDDGREDGIAEQKDKLESTTITENGVYTKEDGWNEVTVQVDVPTFETETLSVELKSNGNYNYTPTTDGYSSVSVTVDVDTSGGGKPKIYNGTIINTGATVSSNNGYPNKVDFSQYDWSRVYDGYYFFNNAFAPSYNTPVDWSNFEENFNSKFLSAKYMFNHNSSGSTASSRTYPVMNGKMDDCLVMSYMFTNNKNTYIFSDIANWNTNKVLTTDRMFYQCESVQNIPLFDTSNVVNMDYMFYYCRNLVNLPEFDMSNVLTTKYMFSNCQNNLNSIPSTLNTGNIRYADNMFYYCQKLTEIPELDWGNLRSCTNMFGYCSKLSKLPNMNTKNVTHFGTGTSNSWLYEVRGIGELGVIDCDSCINIGYMFPNASSVHTLGGFRNLGAQPSLTGTNNTYFLANQYSLTYESIMNVINMLYDRASAGFSVLTLKLHANVLALLSEDDIAIATNKGWTIA